MNTNASPTPTSDRATWFAVEVLARRIIAGPDVRNACQRHLNDLKQGPARGLRWDLAAAQRAIGYYEDVLCLNGGEYEGEPFILNPWQAFVIGSLFGWKAADGYRRFRTAYVETGKGSGKSPLAAGIGLLGMTSDGEARAEVYAAATKKDQAMILFRDAVAMVDQSELLAERIEQSGRGEKVWNLAHPASGSFFRPISADDGQSGPRPHVALLDEIHEHKTRMVVDMMRAGTKSRRQALIVMITNSGHDRTTICYEYHEYGIALCKGDKQDDSFFAFICSLDPGDDPIKDEGCWYKSNPSLAFGRPGDSNGGVPGLKYLREQVTEARGMPSKESSVRRLNFCEWVDAANPWLAANIWMACEDDFDLDEIPEGEPCYGGLDLSGTRDLTALVLYFPRLKKAIAFFWTPKDSLLDRARVDRVPYDAWVRGGFLSAPPGMAVDYAAVASVVGELAVRYSIQGIAFDPYRIKYFTPELEAQGIEVPLLPHGQGYTVSKETGLWMPRSIELTETLLTEQSITIKTNPVLRWNAASAVLDADQKDNRIFAKRRSTGRIDGVVALAMAIGAADLQPVFAGDRDGFFDNPIMVGL
ncbi:terminase large subunit [Pseudomonas sp. HMWF021]|uniref:terminase large subunit n=1 Tax=Pseudomonas sp. HMWF021 TaxID=2056857 RepID=UPI000D3A22D2|nr:terminase TerL endonuclease subunit [Pseudomonas sp. HMWF021]PTT31905.1 phage terminase small subunit P27 family [Pseudomonas sp. HMWF021]